jgi:hypothetical protein
MNDLAELVDLPDPAVQPMVHPLDLPEARRPFRTSWIIGSLSSPPIAALVAALVWFASNNYVVPLIAAATIIGFGMLAGRHFEDQAWAYIPRKRQDRGRPLPVSWELFTAFDLALLLAAVLLMSVVWIDRPDVAAEVREFSFGMGAAAGLLVVVDFLIKLVRRRGDARRQTIMTLPGVIMVAGSVVVGYRVLFDGSGPDSWPTVLWGSALMLLVGAGVGVWAYVGGLRNVHA